MRTKLDDFLTKNKNISIEMIKINHTHYQRL